MKIRELVEITGTPERQIRFMIAEGFVPPPTGGRAHADYGENHVAAIRRYTRLRQQGFTPQAIRVLLANGTVVPLPVAPGVTLQIDPQLFGGSLDVDALVRHVRRAVVEHLKEPTDAHAKSVDRPGRR